MKFTNALAAILLACHVSAAVISSYTPQIQSSEVEKRGCPKGCIWGCLGGGKACMGAPGIGGLPRRELTSDGDSEVVYSVDEKREVAPELQTEANTELEVVPEAEVKSTG
ncbi:hypothetical protein H2198_009725 [Neophaeococcomyces mojaviensis]|uniref:Uncharacterized protein n=1 Tax=Neophaeococcomyces mojaviensis TaxID=3383035 RepID=A0ACC2ZTX5_9EURO|nr:hypothetical protein H2198_009725 [Knufia sp. JES_112]